jgi:tetratricopeptide (TPR) repeat protein
MANLDLILTVDSAVAHCAGALGLPVWLLLALSPDWRWLLKREDSPWYPSMRVFRQTVRGDWDGVFERVAAGIRKLLPARLPAGSPEPRPQGKIVPPSAKTAPAPDTATMLALAMQHHRSGQAYQAEKLYRQVLQAEPGNTDALGYLGSLQLSQGKFAEAAASFQQVLRLRPDSAEIHNDLGVAVAQQGKSEEATASFRKALRLRPQYPEAHNNLGIVLGQRGQLPEAAGHYRQALLQKPDYAEAHNNLGLVLVQQGQLDEAIGHYRQALRLKPGYTEAQENLKRAQQQKGTRAPQITATAPAAPMTSRVEEAAAANRQAINLAMQGRLAESITSFEQALRLNPNYPDAHNNLANVYYFQKRYEEAVACYERALRLRPDFAEALNNLGNSLSCLKRHAEAEVNCRKALALKPDFAGAHNNLGVALKGLRQTDEAIDCYRRALRLQPDFTEAHHNLAMALAEKDDLAGAAACYRQTLRLKPDHAEAHWGLAIVLGEMGQQTEALRCFEQAIRYKPDYAEAHLGRGLTLLMLGRLEEAWPEYEWRRQCRELPRLSTTQPAWDGSPLKGRPILLAVEQGLGDTLQFIRYAPLVHQRGGRVTVWCPGEVKSLLATCPGVENLITDAGDWQHTHAQLLSLPGLFGTSLKSIPAEVPYLSADPALVERWRQELGGKPGLKVGLVWQGNRDHPRDRFRSVPLTRFEPLTRVAGVRLFSLQLGAGSEQLPEWEHRQAVTDLGGRLDRKSVMDTAALVAALDLVITVDTGMAHLAGALGRPVWTLLPFVPDWRWLLDREDSPWYPSMRLFRQTQPGDWESVVGRVAVALAEQSAAEVSR